MNKMRAFLTGATAAGAIAASTLIPAHAANVVDQDLGDAGHVTIDSYGWASLTLDGGPGYLSVYGHAPHQEADVCVGTDKASATCLSSVLPEGGLPVDPTGLLGGLVSAVPTDLLGGVPTL